MDKLESAELDDLPVVIKFLLQTVEPDTVGDVIETLRQNLDFKSISRLQRSSKSKKKAVSQTPEVLILGKAPACFFLFCFRALCYGLEVHSLVIVNFLYPSRM